MEATTRIIPNLWLPGTGAAALDFYTTAFGTGSHVDQQQWYPRTGLLEFQQAMAGELLAADFRLRGHPFQLINAGEEFRPTPAISFMLNFDPGRYPSASEAREDLDSLWDILVDDGEVLMPLDRYDFSDRYGWVQDRYGFSWQLILTDPAAAPRPFLMPAFLFGGAHQNEATAAVSHWTETFPDSAIGNQVHYPVATGPATTASLMFSDMQLFGQWFTAMDSGVEQDFTFNEAVSMSVQCDDQAEIDRYWAALSTDPAAEECGWCKDQFGVSWQIVPKALDTLLQRPGAYERMLQMKKLVIDEF